MAVLKTPCPECDAKLRLTVEGEGDHEVECPKCGHNFTATLEADEPPAKAGKAKKSAKSDEAEKGTKEKAKAKSAATSKKAKAAKRRDDDDEDDDDDDRPKKRKKGDEADGGKMKLIVAGAVAGVLVLGGLGGLIYAMTSKDKTAKNTDNAPAVNQPAQPGPAPGPN